MNVENQEATQNAGQGSSRESNVVVDCDGHAIDLNQPYGNQDVNENNEA